MSIRNHKPRSIDARMGNTSSGILPNQSLRLMLCRRYVPSLRSLVWVPLRSSEWVARTFPLRRLLDCDSCAGGPAIGVGFLDVDAGDEKTAPCEAAISNVTKKFLGQVQTFRSDPSDV